jgi:hypothetical protein
LGQSVVIADAQLGAGDELSGSNVLVTLQSGSVSKPKAWSVPKGSEVVGLVEHQFYFYKVIYHLL